jgi:hypothetical protein
MLFKRTLAIILATFLLYGSACTVIVTLPDTVPTSVSVKGTQPPTATTVPTLAPTLIPTLVPSLVPTDMPATQGSCTASWFFNFDIQHQSLGQFCPEPPRLLQAYGQDFEGGRVYWYAPDPAYPQDQRGTIYVIYNDGEWVTFPDTWDPSQTSLDPALQVPAGRYQPVESIGKVWREFPEVRNRLGWAYEPQVAFQGRFQSYSLIPNPPPDGTGSHYYFIDHGKWGLVLLLNSVDMGPNQWEVAGTYQ